MKKRKEDLEKGAPAKDNNFTDEARKLRIEQKDFDRITKMIESDCEFLMDKQIIDYSLLIGIYEKEKALSKKPI